MVYTSCLSRQQQCSIALLLNIFLLAVSPIAVISYNQNFSGGLYERIMVQALTTPGLAHQLQLGSMGSRDLNSDDPDLTWSQILGGIEGDITWSVTAPLPQSTNLFEPLWNKTYGGVDGDYGRAITECSGGGFALAGSTYNFGEYPPDLWLVRTDSDGNHLWNQSFGKYNGEGCSSVVECTGGGFALAGGTSSYGANPGYSSDMWLIRTDASGNHLWNKTFGDMEEEHCYSLVECSAGGFALAGFTTSFGAGDKDLWLVRTDNSGNHLWNKTFGGMFYDNGYELVECAGGGFAIIGGTQIDSVAYKDVWLVRTDASGNQIWDKTFGGTDVDYGLSIVELDEGGFVFTGPSAADMLVTRTDSDGNTNWSMIYDDCTYGSSVVECSAGGLAVIGYTGSLWSDVWLMRINLQGGLLWSQKYGDTGDYDAHEVVECSSGGFALVGLTTSSGAGDSDMWLLRTPDPPLWWEEEPVNKSAELGEDFFYDVDATSWGGISEWWVNDTTHFAVDLEGVITNTSALLIGVYGLQLKVTDTSANVLAANITVTVRDTQGPIFIDIPFSISITHGETLGYQLAARDPSGVENWAVSDTTNFAISSSGYLTNATSLDVDFYYLTVTVYDSLNNHRGRIFVVIVESPYIPQIDPRIFELAIFIAVIFIIMFVLFLIVLRLNRERGEIRQRPAREVESIPELESPVSGIERPARPSRFQCFECGTVIRGEKALCPECGAKQQRCIICKHFIGQGELYNECPHCKQLAHRSHLLEWLKVKGTCPYCKQKLKQTDIA